MDSDIHYLTYDPEEIWKEINAAYVAAGGDILYPGDEKEMLLRGVQSIITQVFAGVDTALRMDTLRYAVGEYLDIYGEKRNCVRIQAQAATCQVEITFRASGTAKTIPAGTAMTADGERIFLLTEDLEQSGSEQVITAGITCQDSGGAGNGLKAGTPMQLIVSNPAVTGILTITDASGGQDEEGDDVYRERIRNYGLVRHTTGTKTQYESVTMGVTSEILDAEAINLGAGVVGVYLLLKNDDAAEAIIAKVHEALSPQSVRPLTDTVQVYAAEQVPYVLNVEYAYETNANISSALSAAVEEYREWQDNTIGRAFNPDKLTAMLYQAGATRVRWGADSHFNGGTVEYTTISNNAHCKGAITLAVIA